jgi:hypothetical protein
LFEINRGVTAEDFKKQRVQAGKAGPDPPRDDYLL